MEPCGAAAAAVREEMEEDEEEEEERLCLLNQCCACKRCHHAFEAKLFKMLLFCTLKAI